MDRNRKFLGVPELIDALDDMGIQVAASTLANWRATKQGPIYSVIAGRVRYDEADVDRWLAVQVKKTSGGGASAKPRG